MSRAVGISAEGPLYLLFGDLGDANGDIPVGPARCGWIRHPDGVQITVGFKTEAEAKAWITERQAEDAKRGKKRIKAGRCD
jgi:hypothetical protein